MVRGVGVPRPVIVLVDGHVGHVLVLGFAEFRDLDVGDDVPDALRPAALPESREAFRRAPLDLALAMPERIRLHQRDQVLRTGIRPGGRRTGSGVASARPERPDSNR